MPLDQARKLNAALRPPAVIATRNQTSRKGLKWQVLIYD